MIELTERLLAAATGMPTHRVQRWCEPLAKAMAWCGALDSSDRAAAFLAQVGHESGGGQYVRELWGPTDAQRRYEGRSDLGNVVPGDGYKFRGRGLIQITGRANYRECGEALGLPLEDQPELLEEPDNAAMSAAWYWETRGCNELADEGDYRRLTLRINGGYNGYEDRVSRMQRALEAFDCA